MIESIDLAEVKGCLDSLAMELLRGRFPNVDVSPTTGWQKPIIFQPFQSLDAPLFTGEGLILSAVLLMPVFFKAFKTWWQRARYSRELVLD